MTLESALPEARVALIIGNGAYEFSPLKNPVNDARLMAQTLGSLGFQVTLKENVNQIEMKRAIREFGEKIRNGGVGLFYFAGHGVQVKGQNYLIPVGSVITMEEEVEYEGLDAGFVMAQMANAKNRMNIVILDACRNNPFARSFRSESNGLASINAPSGTLIAYATAPGSVASDGVGQNGLYTQELLLNMRTVGLNIEEVFKRVRVSVIEKTDNKQTPWESSSLTGAFYFVNPNSDGKPKPFPSTQTTIATVDPVVVDLAFWDSIKNSKAPEDYQAYLDKFPNGQFASIAKRRVSIPADASPGKAGETDAGSVVNLLPEFGDVSIDMGKFGRGSLKISIVGKCVVKTVETAIWNWKARFSDTVVEKVFNLSESNISGITVNEVIPPDRPRMWTVYIKMMEGRTFSATTTGYENSELTKVKIPAKTDQISGGYVAVFMDAESANRFAKALANAARACGAKSESF